MQALIYSLFQVLNGGSQQKQEKRWQQHTMLMRNIICKYFNYIPCTSPSICRGEHKMQLRRNTGSGSEEDPTHNGKFTVESTLANGW